MELDEIYKNYRLIAGVDEVGRGPLVGAVIAAAVILDPDKPIAGLRDSKRLSEKRREELALEIREKALAWSLGRAERQEIDEINILRATLHAMQRAVNALTIHPEFVLVDGNKLPLLTYPAQAVVKGDSLVQAISAASILAKVTRDQEMRLLDEQYPQYGFADHKGYPTARHLQALRTHGPLLEHRRSFGPVRDALGQRLLGL